MRRAALVAALALLALAAQAALSGLAGGDTKMPEPPEATLTFGGGTQTAILNSYSCCEPRSFLDQLPGREPCSGMDHAAPLYPADTLTGEAGSPMVFTFEVYEPSRVSVSGLEDKVMIARVSGDRAEAGEREVNVSADFHRVTSPMASVWWSRRDEPQASCAARRSANGCGPRESCGWHLQGRAGAAADRAELRRAGAVRSAQQQPVVPTPRTGAVHGVHPGGAGVSS